MKAVEHGRSHGVSIDNTTGSLTGGSRESTALFLADCSRISYQTKDSNQFNRFLRSISKNTHLYVRAFDPIPLLPGNKLGGLGYTHVKRQLLLREGGSVSEIDVDLDDSPIGLSAQIKGMWDILRKAQCYAQIPMAHDLRSYIKDRSASNV